jgi:3',5'-cyclic AMP phosphodiesterase CpdA
MKRFFFIILVCTASLLFAGESGEDFRFVYFTDVHLEEGKNAVQGFESALKKINELNPDFVISGGDNIADALAVPYEKADMLYTMYKDIIKKLNMPIYNILGNHDVFGSQKKSGVESTHPEFGKKMFARRLNKTYYAFDHKGWHFIVLDSVLIDSEGNYFGNVDLEQRDWLKDHLPSIDPEIPIIISMHVPFYSIIPQMDKRFRGEVFTVNNSAQVLDLFKDHNLKAVLQGHVHYHEVIEAGGVHFISGGAVCGAWWDGSNKGVEEGFLLLDIKGDEFGWEYIDYGWEVKK